MTNPRLYKKIERKLDQLHELLDQFDEARVIDSNDPDTWDSDTLYDLAENCQAILKLLEDQESKQLDELGQPIILEEGLCSLVDSYQSEEESQDI
jgi:hypothetical protein